MSAFNKGFVYSPNQICEGTINLLIPERDAIKTLRDSGLTSLAFKEHRETLVVHFPADLNGLEEEEETDFDPNCERQGSKATRGVLISNHEPLC